MPEQSTGRKFGVQRGVGPPEDGNPGTFTPSLRGRRRDPEAPAPRRAAAAGLQPTRRNGTLGPGSRQVLDAGPEAGEELLLRAVAVGPHCLQELSGIRRGRTGSLFHWDSSRVPAAAEAVGCRVSLCPPRTSLLPFLPPSVS